jgi:hypothetical protein
MESLDSSILDLIGFDLKEHYLLLLPLPPYRPKKLERRHTRSQLHQTPSSKLSPMTQSRLVPKYQPQAIDSDQEPQNNDDIPTPRK